MASDLGFVEYVCEQISGAGKITYKKMFGEYGIYCNSKIIGLICDNQLFIKRTEAGTGICPDYEEVPPYDGAKPYFLIDNVDDYDLMSKFISATYEELPAAKPKRKRNRS